MLSSSHVRSSPAKLGGQITLMMMLVALPARSDEAAPLMTGQQLLKLAAAPAKVSGTFDMTPAQYLDSERVRLYVEGVHDITADRLWCRDKRYPASPGVVYEAALAGLRAMNLEKLKGNAAELIVGVWSRRWPCQRTGSGS